MRISFFSFAFTFTRYHGHYSAISVLLTQIIKDVQGYQQRLILYLKAASCYFSLAEDFSRSQANSYFTLISFARLLYYIFASF